MQNVSKRFGATLALDQVSIEVAPAQVLALVGENGAGFGGRTLYLSSAC